jgi:hypothetical protein
MTLPDKIKQIYSDITDEDFANSIIVLRNDCATPPDGKVKVGNDYIDSWNHPTLAQPTQAQLDAITE